MQTCVVVAGRAMAREERSKKKRARETRARERENGCPVLSSNSCGGNGIDGETETRGWGQAQHNCVRVRGRVCMLDVWFVRLLIFCWFLLSLLSLSFSRRMSLSVVRPPPSTSRGKREKKRPWKISSYTCRSGYLACSCVGSQADGVLACLRVCVSQQPDAPLDRRGRLDVDGMA
jgi:hypothetical protein